MKKQLILLLAFLGLGLFVYFYEIEGEEDRQEAARIEKSLLKLDQSQVSALELLKPSNSNLRIEKAGESWVLRAPVEAAADKTAVEALLRNLEEAEIDKKFEANELAEYGLEVPRMELRLVVDGETSSIRFGTDSFDKRLVYVQLQGDDHVYLTSNYLFTVANKELREWRDRKVLTFDRSKVQKIEMQRGAETVILSRQDQEWELVAPFEDVADQSQVSSLLSSFEFAEVETFEMDAGGDLAHYGLEESDYRLRLLEEGSELWKTLELGAEIGQARYARDPERASVFTVKNEIWEKLRQPVWDLRDKSVLRVDQSDIVRLRLERDAVLIELSHQDFKWSFENPADFSGQEALSYKFWYPIDDLAFDSIEEAEPEGGFPEPLVRLQIDLSDGSNSYEFWRRGDDHFARRVAPQRWGRISKEGFEKLLFEPGDILSE